MGKIYLKTKSTNRDETCVGNHDGVIILMKIKTDLYEKEEV